MQEEEPFDSTTGDIARMSGAQPDLVRLYADLMLIESRRLSNGTRTFQKSAAARVKALKAERLANRGSKRAI